MSTHELSNRIQFILNLNAIAKKGSRKAVTAEVRPRVAVRRKGMLTFAPPLKGGVPVTVSYKQQATSYLEAVN